MRLLTFTNCELTESSGSGYVVGNYSRGLQNRGHDVQVVEPEHYIAMPGRKGARFLRLSIGMWQKAHTAIRNFRPDVVEFYGGEAWLATDRLSRTSRRPFKIVAHSNGIETFVADTLKSHGISNTVDGRRPKWYRPQLHMPIERAFTSADAIVTVSHNEAGYARRRGFQPTDRVLAIDNALPEAFLGQLLTLERPKTIGYCGSWVARKGTDLLVVEMTKVLREVPDWQLHLVGVGDGFRPESHFPPDVMPRIKVTGFIADKTEQRRVYQSWAIAVMPSLYESFGLVAAEAMSCGCALVASRTGFPAALSNGVEALILEEPRSPHLSSAALSLIADEALRRRIAEAGWERVQSLRWDDNIEKLESFYLHLVGQQRLNSTVHS